MSDSDQREKIIKLLTTAEALANDLGQGTLAYLIERASTKRGQGLSA